MADITKGMESDGLHEAAQMQYKGVTSAETSWEDMFPLPELDSTPSRFATLAYPIAAQRNLPRSST